MSTDSAGLEQTDAQIILPPDSTGKGIHLVEVKLVDVNGNPFTAYQEVVTLADSDGNSVAVTGQGRPRLLVTSPRQFDLLVDILRALLEIKAVLMAGLGTEGTDLLIDSADYFGLND